MIDVIKNVLTLDILVPYILYIYIREGQSFYLKGFFQESHKWGVEVDNESERKIISRSRIR